MIALAEVEAAARRLRGRLVRTPLLASPTLGERCGRRVLLKLENRQEARCFKPRGALNAALLAAERGPVPGLLTFSSGNHGQAVALAASVLGVPCVVVAPEDVRPGKRAAMEARGARVVTRGLTSTERMARALELQRELGYALIPPYDHPDVVAGQGTVALEILEDAPDVAACVVPVGGGGLISGIATVMSARRPECPVTGVEPMDGDDARRSLSAGALLANAAPCRSACDGLRNTRLGDLNWSIVRSLVKEIVTVDEAAVDRGVGLLEADGLGPVEPSGAAAAAALLAGRIAPGDGPVVAILSGGNT